MYRSLWWTLRVLLPFQYLMLGWRFVIHGESIWMVVCVPIVAVLYGALFRPACPVEGRGRFLWLYGRVLKRYASGVLNSYCACMALVGFALVYPSLPTIWGYLTPRNVAAQIGVVDGSLHRAAILLSLWLAGSILCRFTELFGNPPTAVGVDPSPVVEP